MGAVVGVFFDVSEGGAEESAWIKSVRDGIASKGEVAPTEPDIVSLFDSLDFDDYFSYNGSLTTPPCTEGIKWNVLNKIQTISPEQLAEFTSLLADDVAFAGGNGNNRIVQGVNGRAIYSSAIYENADFDAAFAANAGAATFDWVEVNAGTQDVLRMIKITSNKDGAPSAAADLGPVLLVSSYT